MGILGDGPGHPFLRTYLGCIAFILVLFATAVGFYTLSDRTPKIIDGSPSVQGYSIVATPFLPGLYSLLFTSLAVTGLVVGIAILVNHRSSSPTVTGFVTTVSFLLCLYLSPLSITIELLGRPLWRVPPNLPLVGLLATSTLVGFVAAAFSRPLLPRIDSNDSAVDRFMTNQWRYAQAVLSATFAGIIGISIPFSLSFSSIRVLGLVATLTALVTAPAAIVGFVILRLHRTESHY